jgi:hypothetical protein
MTVYGAIFAAISRKIAAFMAEVRTLVNAATIVEKKIVADAKAEVKTIVTRVKTEKTNLQNDLVDKISKI